MPKIYTEKPYRPPTMPKRSRGWESKRVVIPILPETRSKLKKLGTMDDTFDSVIKKLIDHWEKTHR